MTTPKFALDVVLPPQTGQTQALHDFVASGRAIVLNEPGTLHWFGFKADAQTDGTPAYFGIFDTFASSDGRAAHLSGDVAKALLANAPTLLNGGPQIAPVDVIGQQIAPKVQQGSPLTVGLRVILTAKPDKAGALKNVLLEGAASAQQQTEETTAAYWSSFQKDETAFGIIALFYDEEDRSKHLSAAAADQLSSKLDGLLVGAPETHTFTVIATKV
ncbi:hypothetical protein FA95DRAFT_110608 [Auriscalpium vulgare]|uniref:Uncharacterized protein n=1 Tax=Auriscalpium vulgare TaxID=40419 RepID=A0ACB8S773_9AGAM|nr:hypothetical protein FA95DRAFT_110608 [Auriscalpium vulgare]